MSNPAVFLLDSTYIHDQTIRIEDNLGEAIHLHVGDWRVSFTIDEFYKFYDAVIEAAGQLFDLYGIKFDLLDLTALDWDWLYRYDEIDSITMDSVNLKDLWSVRNDCWGNSRICKVSDTRLSKALNGHFDEAEKFIQKNRVNKSNLERLEDVVSFVEKNGYPYNNKYIMVDQNLRIYDGDHRAAALYHKYGNITVPVLKIQFRNEPPIKKQLYDCWKNATKRTIKTIIKKILSFPKKVLKKIINRIASMHIQAQDRSKHTDFDEKFDLEKMLNSSNVNYYFLDTSWLENGEKKIFHVVLEKDGISKVLENNKIIYRDAYPDMETLYSIYKPIETEINDNIYILQEAIICKSKYENAVMPADRKLQEYAWNNVCESENGRVADRLTNYVYSVLYTAFFRDNYYNDKVVGFLKSYRYLLSEDMLYDLLSREFFEFTDTLISLLKEEKFDEIKKHYDTYKEY